MVATSSTPPNVQMAQDGVALLSERQRLDLAFDLVRDAKIGASIAILGRIAHMATETARELKARRVASTIGEVSSIDIEFMAVFLAHYDRAEAPGFAMAYRHAKMEVEARRLGCEIPSSESVKWALKHYRCGMRGAA